VQNCYNCLQDSNSKIHSLYNLLQIIKNYYNICTIIEKKSKAIVKETIAKILIIIDFTMLVVNFAKTNSNIKIMANNYDFFAIFATINDCIFKKTKNKVLLNVEIFCANSKNNCIIAKDFSILLKTLA